MSKIRIYIADDHAVLRSGLKLLMECQDDMAVVGEAGDFLQVLSNLPTLQPDVITLDLSMPGGLGLGAIEKVREIAPTCRVIVLTMHDDPAFLRTALAMGASGYVVKSAADTELLSAIRAVYQGRIFVDAISTTSYAVSIPSSGKTPKDSIIDKLSKREREVLGLIARGYTNQAVADELEVGIKTVESYRSRLRDKLGLKNRADITRFAIEQGMLNPGPSEPHL